ncbi:MAG: hypothetical protein ACPHEN_08850, partial [Candidatus Poseidoniaceae archaeon]
MGQGALLTTGLKSIPTCVCAGVPMLAKPTTKIQPAAVKAVVLCLLFVLSSQLGMLSNQPKIVLSQDNISESSSRFSNQSENPGFGELDRIGNSSLLGLTSREIHQLDDNRSLFVGFMQNSITLSNGTSYGADGHGFVLVYNVRTNAVEWFENTTSSIYTAAVLDEGSFTIGISSNTNYIDFLNGITAPGSGSGAPCYSSYKCAVIVELNSSFIVQSEYWMRLHYDRLHSLTPLSDGSILAHGDIRGNNRFYGSSGVEYSVASGSASGSCQYHNMYVAKLNLSQGWQ